MDLVSAPPGTALVFYGPPALQVHAMPLLSQHDLVQSAAALAAQHCTSKHGSAQRDSPLPNSPHHDSAQHETAQRDSAQTTDTEPDQSSSPENNRVTSHSSEHYDAADSQPGMFSTHQDLHQVPHEAHSEADDVMLAQHSSKEPWQEEDKHPRLQAELPGIGHQHTALRHQRAAAGEEDEGVDKGLFAESSVLARGGLKVTEKASLVVSEYRGEYCTECDSE